MRQERLGRELARRRECARPRGEKERRLAAARPQATARAPRRREHRARRRAGHRPRRAFRWPRSLPMARGTTRRRCTAGGRRRTGSCTRPPAPRGRGRRRSPSRHPTGCLVGNLANRHRACARQPLAQNRERIGREGMLDRRRSCEAGTLCGKTSPVRLTRGGASGQSLLRRGAAIASRGLDPEATCAPSPGPVTYAHPPSAGAAARPAVFDGDQAFREALCSRGARSLAAGNRSERVGCRSRGGRARFRDRARRPGRP